MSRSILEFLSDMSIMWSIFLSSKTQFLCCYISHLLCTFLYIYIYIHIHSTLSTYIHIYEYLYIYIYQFSHANKGSLSSSIFASKRSAWPLSHTKRSKFVFSDSHLRLIKICNEYSYINCKDVCPPRNILSDFIDIKTYFFHVNLQKFLVWFSSRSEVYILEKR